DPLGRRRSRHGPDRAEDALVLVGRPLERSEIAELRAFTEPLHPPRAVLTEDVDELEEQSAVAVHLGRKARAVEHRPVNPTLPVATGTTVGPRFSISRIARARLTGLSSASRTRRRRRLSSSECRVTRGLRSGAASAPKTTRRASRRLAPRTGFAR